MLQTVESLICWWSQFSPSKINGEKGRPAPLPSLALQKCVHQYNNRSPHVTDEKIKMTFLRDTVLLLADK